MNMESKPIDRAEGINREFRSGRDEEHVARQNELKNAQQQMNSSSKDWTKLANILRRACGGFSRSRLPRH